MYRLDPSDSCFVIHGCLINIVRDQCVSCMCSCCWILESLWEGNITLVWKTKSINIQPKLCFSVTYNGTLSKQNKKERDAFCWLYVIIEFEKYYITENSSTIVSAAFLNFCMAAAVKPNSQSSVPIISHEKWNHNYEIHLSGTIGTCTVLALPLLHDIIALI